MAAISHGRATVAAAGTAVPLATGTEAVFASWIIFTPCKASGADNAGNVRIGGTPPVADAGAIPVGKGLILKPTAAPMTFWPQWGYDLRQIYIDADNATDGVAFAYGTA